MIPVAADRFRPEPEYHRRHPIINYLAEHYADHAGLLSVATKVNRLLDAGEDVTPTLVDLLFRDVTDDWLAQFTDRTRANQAKVQQRKRDGYVYFLRNGERIKIGYSTDPRARAVSLSLRESDILGVIKAERRMESTLHEVWAAIRVGNTEWFHATDELLSWIDRAATRWDYRHPSKRPPTMQDNYRSLLSAIYRP